jgi:hypothetical protein
MEAKDRAQKGEPMVTFETTDRKLARRFLIAQFNGRTTSCPSDGSMVTDHVQSVLQNKASIPARWTIAIVPCACWVG